jgi:hypothetical protein
MLLCVGVWLAPAGAVSAQDGPKKARVPPALQKQINDAIDKGRDYLKRTQQNSTWPRGGEDTPGSTALAAWTLLECGVAPTDPAVQVAADAIRKWAVRERRHYHISLMIFFFNKLGDSEDVPLIESLAYRLLASQNRDGIWSYFSEDVPSAEQQRLQGVIAKRKGNQAALKLPRKLAQLDPAIQQQLSQLGSRQVPQGHPATMAGGDNSNTQFAILALWVAQKYGIPAQTALLRAAQRFLETEAADGSWPYMNIKMGGPRGGFPGGGPPDGFPPGAGPPGGGMFGSAGMRTPAMTCAGLLGLTLGHASTPQGQGPNAKNVLLRAAPFQAGLRHLGRILRGAPGTDPGGKVYYFMWSLERVGVVCDLDLIDGFDWYGRGAKKLVDAQSENGSWQGGAYAAGGCDTCFALLFLTRANVAEDLPRQLLGQLPVAIEQTPKKANTPRGEPAFRIDGPGVIEGQPKKGAEKSKSGGGG